MGHTRHRSMGGSAGIQPKADWPACPRSAITGLLYVEFQPIYVELIAPAEGAEAQANRSSHQAI